MGPIRPISAGRRPGVGHGALAGQYSDDADDSGKPRKKTQRGASVNNDMA